MRNEANHSNAFPSPVLGEGTTPAGGWVRGVIACILLCGIILTIIKFSQNKPCANFNEAILLIPEQAIYLALANTPEKQSKGLGGCKYVPENSGMYFGPFDTAQGQNATFWMKNMLIPIDIIWLKDNQVVGIEKNVPSFPLDTPDEELPNYTSPEPVDAVLEVGAGMAEEYGIKEGSEITLKP